MDISKYAAFFHDGSIKDIRHVEDKIEFLMVSAEMHTTDVKDANFLSKDSKIKGRLHLEGVKLILVDGAIFLGSVTKKYDNGRIFDFEINENSVELAVDWVNFPPKPEVNDFSVIKIEAKKIWWENTPNL